MEDTELDQYLHSTGAGRGSGLPPPPPYIPSNPTSSPSVAAAHAWASAYKIGGSTASGQLQRMAQSGSGNNGGGPQGQPQGQPESNCTPGSPNNNPGTANTSGGSGSEVHHTGNTSTGLHHHNSNIPNSDSYATHHQQGDTDDTSPHSIKMEQSGLSAHFSRGADKYAFDMQTRFPFSSLTAESSDMDYVSSSDAAGQYYAQSSAAMYSAAAANPVSYQCMASGIRSLYPTPGGSTPQVAVSPINAATQWDRFTRP